MTATRTTRLASVAILIVSVSCCGDRGEGPRWPLGEGPVDTYVKGESIEEVQTSLDAALETSPRDPLLLALAGDIAYFTADFDEAMELFTRALEALPGWDDPMRDRLGEMILVSIDSLSPYVTDYEQKLSEAHALLPELYGTTDGTYLVGVLQRVRALARAGRFEESRELRESGGCLVDWKATGPFGDTELLSFDESHPPELDQPWQAAYALREGEDPTPTIDGLTYHCTVSIEPEVGFRGGTFYAATDLSVHRDGDYVFRMFSSHSTQVLIDGVPVFDVDRRFEHHPDIVMFRTRLTRGEHTLNVKLGTRDPFPGFSLLWKEAASSSPDPALPPAITARMHGDAVSGTAPPPAHAVEIPLPEPTSAIEALVGAEIALYRRDTASARRWLTPLYEDRPRSATILPRMQTIEWNDPFVPYAQSMNRVRAVVETSMKEHPRIWVSHYLAARIESSLGREEQAIEILKHALEVVGPFAGFHMFLADLYASKGWIGESVNSLEEASSLLEGNCLKEQMEYRIASSFGDLDGMESAAEAIGQCDATDPTLLGVYLDRNKWAEASAEQDRLHALHPDRDEYVLDDAIMASKLGDHERYVKGLSDYHDEHPTDYSVIGRLVDEHLASGDRGTAIGMLEEARGLLEGPTDDISLKIALIEDWDYLFLFRRDAESAIASYEVEVGDGTEVETPSVEVLDHVTHRIFPDGSTLTRYHSVRKMITREGVEANSEFIAPPGAGILRLRTIKPDGRVLQPESIAGKMTLSYPALEPGDYTEAEWIQATGPSMIHPGGFSLGRWYFQVLDLTLHHSEMIVVAPSGMEIDINPRGEPPEVVKMEDGALNVMRWTARRMPHRKGEPDAPAFSEFLPSLQLSHGADWAGYFDWLTDILIDTHVVSPAIRDEVDSLVEDIDPGDVEARARAIFRWVNDEIEEGDGLDRPVSHIYEDRQGNRARLLYAMLDAAGVPSELWVVRTVYADHTPSDVADFDVFTQLAVKVEDSWLVPFVDTLPYGVLVPALRGEEAMRLLPTRASATTPTTPVGASRTTRVLDIEVDASGNGEAVLVETFRGVDAAIMRATLEQLPRSEMDKEVEGAYLSMMFTGARLVELVMSDLDSDEDEFVLEIRFELPPMPGPFPGSIALGPFLKSNLSKIWTTLPERHFPLLVDEPTSIEVEISIRTGGKWFIFQPPSPNASIETSGGGRFEQVFEESKGEFVVRREIVLPSGRVAPTDYPELLDFTTRIDETEGGVFILSKKPFD